VAVQQGGTVFARITAGLGSTCGQTAAGQSWCWGFNGYGQLGDGTVVNRHVPVQVNQRGIAYEDITGGWTHYCARSSPRLVLCWGGNDGGQIGDSTFQHRSAPVRVRQGTERYVQMSGGHLLTCALSGTGQAYCWGWNSNGQLGDDTDVSRRTPVAVQQGATKFVQISAGGFYACGLTAAGQAWCWGHGTSGQLGDNAGTNRFTPVAVQQGGSAYVEITTGFRQTCGRTAVGRVECWGDNTYGQLGNATTFGAVLAPVAVQPAP
jgi:alpha-tubulin suppressor-like RCC1 family protein